jgi:FKBP12-rapamycin complex-associated protein
MDDLLDVVGAGHESILIRLANGLRQLLQQSTTDSAILHGAAAALGHLARLASPLTVDLVNFQVKQAFEWIQQQEAALSPNASRLLAAVLVLKELAANAPTLFNVYVPLFLEVIFLPIRSTRVDVREAATLALRVCLLDIATRAERWRKQCWVKVFSQAQAGLQTQDETASTVQSESQSSSSVASSLPAFTKPRSSESVHEATARIHGSLLTLGELLEHATDDFLAPHFQLILQLILIHRHHTSKTVRRTVMVLMPRAARLNPGLFRTQLTDVVNYFEHHMESDLSVTRATAQRAIIHVPTLTHSCVCMVRPFSRDTALLSLGRLSSSMGSALLPMLPPLLSHVSSNLSLTLGVLPDTSAPPSVTKSTSFFGFGKKTTDGTADSQAETQRRNLRFTNTAMACVSMLAASLQEQLRPFIDPLVDLMLQSGLSQPLIDCLASLTTHLPSLRPLIQDRLLEDISMILQPPPSHREVTAVTAPPSFYSFAFKPARPPQQKVTIYGSPALKSAPATLPGGRVPVSLLPPASRLTAIRTPSAVREHDTNAILLALRTLASFDFGSQELLVLAMARELIAPLLAEAQEDIRREAARTMTQILPTLAVEL